MLGRDVATLLVVEDDLRLRALYARTFESPELSVLTAAGLLDARSILKSTTPSAVILDIGLEDDSGLQLLDELPAETVVVVVTGRHEKDLVREVLACGADDVVFKPFVIGELTARVLGRIEARTRRQQDNTVGGSACLKVDLDACMLSCARERRITQLSEREGRALRLLLQARGEVVSRETLSLEVHNEQWDPSSRRVDALVSRLRRKLECDACGAQRALSTVHNRGYRFAGPSHIAVLNLD
jgi:DNA-binding response OmpR family regulator